MRPGYYWAKTDSDHDWEVVRVFISLGKMKVMLLGNDTAFDLDVVVEWGKRILQKEDLQ